MKNSFIIKDVNFKDSNYGIENYKKWLNAFLPSNTLTFDHLQPCSSKS